MFNAMNKFDEKINRFNELTQAYKAEADTYRRKAAILTTADPKESARLLKAADAISAKAAVAEAEANAATETYNAIKQRTGMSEAPANPMGGGVRLEGNIGGGKPSPSKPVPGKPSSSKKKKSVSELANKYGF
jgi:hypothetical protein